MANTPLDRFHVVLEEQTGAGTTQRTLSLRDVMNMVNEEPGTIGCVTVSKTVVVSGDETAVCTLPKGAKVQSVNVKELTAPSDGKVSIGIKDGESFGPIASTAPAPAPTPVHSPEKPGTTPEKVAPPPEKVAPPPAVLNKTMDGKALEKESKVVLKHEGKGKPEGSYMVVITYEKYNEL